MKRLFLIALLALAPQVALAGTQTYSTPGTYTFTVPAYGTLTAEVWGGGGGGEGGSSGGVGAGGTGGTSSVDSTVYATGGRGGGTVQLNGGAGGSGYGGDTSTSGSAGVSYSPGGSGRGGDGANGGTGGAGGTNGGVPGGGGGGGSYSFRVPSSYTHLSGGGGGGYVAKTYSDGSEGAPQPGATIPIEVGVGGQSVGARTRTVGRYTYYYGASGAGASGKVIVTWTDLPAPTCSITVDQNPITAGNSTTLRWSSSYASSFYISNVGYVSGSGAATIAPNTTTSYSGTVSNSSGTGTCGTTLTVNPACSPSYGQSCTSSANACGQTTTGTYSCSGVCSATTPANPAGYGSACTSAANACGQTNTGTIQCNGQCSATKPPNSNCGNPTCSVTFDANPAPYGIGTTMRWTSARAASFTIQNVGPVTPNVAGSAHVAPSSSTSYAGSVVGHNGNTVSCPATLNISAPANPTATISSSLGSTVKIGQSSTITATFTAGNGDTILNDNIDSPEGTGLGATANPDATKNVTFTPSSPGTFTFYARARTAYYPWTTYAQTSVTVPPLPSCSVTFDQNPIVRGAQTIVRWSSSNSISFILQTIGPVTPNQSGSVTVAPQSTTNYSGSASGAGGSASCPATLTVQCTPSTTYSCSGQTILRTDTAASCSTTISNTTTCTAPAFCSAGSSVCLYPEVQYAPDGHLTARPAIVPTDVPSHVTWDVANVTSCTVTGSNGDTWTVAGTAGNGWTSASPPGGETTSPITEQTIYTLTCTGLDGSRPASESAIVNVLPIFQEL